MNKSKILQGMYDRHYNNITNKLYEAVPRSVKSFPAITKNGVFIGGLSDLQHDLRVEL